MRTLLVGVALGAMVVFSGGVAAGHPGSIVFDDPADRPHLGLGLNGAGISSVELFLGNQAPAASSQRGGRNLRLVGSLKLDPFNRGAHGDVAGYKNLALVGKWRGECPGTGVDIIDISNPAAPVKLADTRDYPNTSMEDMSVMKIRGRDILAIGLQDCGNPVPGTVGLELYDITNPRSPQFLSLFNGEDFAELFPPDMADEVMHHGHVHELSVTRTPGGRTLALLSSPDLEAITARNFPFADGIGDLLIVDITNPAKPFLAGHWGVLQEPALGLNVYLDSPRGGDARTLLHSVRANKNGTRAYASYWDAGFIILDIRDPANPKYLGRTQYGPTDEGNAHSVVDARGGNLLVAADEDFSPFELRFTSSAFAGERPAVEGSGSPPIVDLPGRRLTGELVHVGRGCPAGAIEPGSPADPYLGNPAGKIALIQRGACRFDHKIVRAQQAGATGAIVYGLDGDETLVLMGIDNPTTMPDGTLVPITIASVFVQNSTGVLLRDGTPPVTATAAAVFNGWGYLRIFDISNPANPVQLSTFATANTNNEAVATQGVFSVHNPEMVGDNKIYASWYSDGVRVIDVRNPSRPEEIAFWTGAGAPADAPPVDIWSVVPHGDILLASDRNFGLYVLKMKP